MQNKNNANYVGKKDKQQRNEIASSDLTGAVALAVVLFGGVMIYVAHYYVNEHSASIKFFSEAMFSFLALLVVVAQVVIYSQQRDAMKQQVEIARIAERGYVGIQKAIILNGLAVGERPVIHITLLNGGRTPIWKMMNPTRVRIGTVFPPGRPKLFREEGAGFLPAGLTREIQFILPNPITQERFDAITDGTEKIFINGETHFEDCWNEKRVYPFQLVYVPRLNQFADYKGDDYRGQDAASSLPIDTQPVEDEGAG
jgi:hypothetical protein